MKHRTRTPSAIVAGCHSIGYGIIRSLGEENVPVVAVSYSHKDMGTVSRYVRQAEKIAHPETHSAQFLEQMEKIGRRLGGGILFPSDDATLSTISRNKKYLSDFFTVACPEWAVIRRIIDKRYTYEIAAINNIAAPKTFCIENESQIDAVKDRLSFPSIIKPRRSHLFAEQFHCKAFKANTEAELKAYFALCKAHRLSVMVQEFIPGPDTLNVNYNSFFRDGRPLAEFTARKVRLSQPSFGIPRCVRSQKIPEIIAPGRKILNAVGFQGYSCTEFKQDPRDGVYKLLEINGRHNRSGLLALKCGINFPFTEYQYLCGGKDRPYRTFKQNVFWIDEFHDLFSTIKYRKHEAYSIRDYLRPYLRSNIFSIYNPRDLSPFLFRIRNLYAQLIGRAARNGFNEFGG